MNTDEQTGKLLPAPAKGRPQDTGRSMSSAIVWGLCAGVLLSCICLAVSSSLCGVVLHMAPVKNAPANRSDSLSVAYSQCLGRLRRQLDALVPASACLIVCSSDNTFVLVQDRVQLRQGLCSTGSYVLLKTRDNSRRWIFSTPRGMFRVQQKLEDPVWRRPDWAFIEEGKPVPSPDSPERFERGVLGEYAMILGGGYMVHGTLYQRFLGRPVTHGCVRMGDDDLEAVFRTMPVGSRVYMY